MPAMNLLRTMSDIHNKMVELRQREERVHWQEYTSITDIIRFTLSDRILFGPLDLKKPYTSELSLI